LPGKQIKKLPENIGALDSLSFFFIRDNLLERLPESIMAMKTLYLGSRNEDEIIICVERGIYVEGNRLCDSLSPKVGQWLDSISANFECWGTAPEDTSRDWRGSQQCGTPIRSKKISRIRRFPDHLPCRGSNCFIYDEFGRPIQANGRTLPKQPIGNR
jgi:hypothetical protein